MLPVFLDTCVLLKPYLCDSMLSIAESGIYRPLWSPTVLDELRRNLIRRGLDDKQIRHRLDQMDEAFPDAQPLVASIGELLPTFAFSSPGSVRQAWWTLPSTANRHVVRVLTVGAPASRSSGEPASWERMFRRLARWAEC